MCIVCLVVDMHVYHVPYTVNYMAASSSAECSCSKPQGDHYKHREIPALFCDSLLHSVHFVGRIAAFVFIAPYKYAAAAAAATAATALPHDVVTHIMHNSSIITQFNANNSIIKPHKTPCMLLNIGVAPNMKLIFPDNIFLRHFPDFWSIS